MKIKKAKRSSQPDGELVLAPFSDNREFARRRSVHQAKSRLGFFLGPHIHKPHMLQQLVWCKLICFDQVSRGSLGPCLSATADLLCEALKLRWPPCWIGKSLRALPRRHNTPYLGVVRHLGKSLGKATPRDMLPEVLEFMLRHIAKVLGARCEKYF